MNRILLNTIGLSKGNENILLQLSEVFPYFLVVVLVEVIGGIVIIFVVNEAIVNVFYFGVQWFDQNFKVGSSFWNCSSRLFFWRSLTFNLLDFILHHGSYLFLILHTLADILCLDIVVDRHLMFLNFFIQTLNFILKLVINFIELLSQSC